jgi:hypothetical protein
MLNNEIIQRNCILFLGAGASTPLGLKTTSEFLQLLPQKCLQFWQSKGTDFGNEQAVRQFLDTFFQISANHFNMKQPDIENVLDYIDFLLKIGNETKGFPKQILSLSGITNFEGWVRYFTELRGLLQQCVVEHYSNVDGKQVFQLYHPLLSFVCSNIKYFPIYTTNYDWVFEHLVESHPNEYRLIDGFTSGGGLGERWMREVFDNYGAVSQNVDLILFKLHGSTSWYKNKQGGIKRFAEPAPQIGQSKVVLVYPTQVKAEAIQEEPFKTSYEYFKSALEHTKKCIIIGFSFRDPAINNLFSIALAKNRELMLIIIDQAADRKYKENLAQKFSLEIQEFTNRIHCFKDSFGSTEAVNHIIQEINSI